MVGGFRGRAQSCSGKHDGVAEQESCKVLPPYPDFNASPTFIWVENVVDLFEPFFSPPDNCLKCN